MEQGVNLALNCYKGKGNALERGYLREIDRSDSKNSWVSYWEFDKTTGWYKWDACWWFHAVEL